MNQLFHDRGGELDYYTLFLQRHLATHHFPEAEDELFIAARADMAYNAYVESRLAGDEMYISNEKAIDVLYKGFEISPYDFVSTLLLDEFTDHISLDDRSIEFWTYTLLNEMADEFENVALSDDFLNTNEGAVFRLGIIGRMTLYFERYGL